MTYDEIGEVDLRGENTSKAVRGFMMKSFKMMAPLIQVSSSKWTETYYAEEPTILTGGGNRNVQGVARGALFPEVHPSWEKTSADHIKFAAKDTIYYEDSITDAINVQARSMTRVAEAVANSVDAYIYAQLTAAGSTAGVVAASGTWNNANPALRDPIGDILIGIAAISGYNYNFRQNGYILMNETDYSSLLRNSKVINNPSFKTADVVSNGIVGQICSGKIIVSNTVTATECMLVVGQKAATFLTAARLQTAVIPDPGVNIKLKAWMVGQIQITDARGLYTITGTA